MCGLIHLRGAVIPFCLAHGLVVALLDTVFFLVLRKVKFEVYTDVLGAHGARDLRRRYLVYIAQERISIFRCGDVIVVPLQACLVTYTMASTKNVFHIDIYGVHFPHRFIPHSVHHVFLQVFTLHIRLSGGHVLYRRAVHMVRFALAHGLDVGLRLLEQIGVILRPCVNVVHRHSGGKHVFNLDLLIFGDIEVDLVEIRILRRPTGNLRGRYLDVRPRRHRIIIAVLMRPVQPPFVGKVLDINSTGLLIVEGVLLVLIGELAGENIRFLQEHQPGDVGRHDVVGRARHTGHLEVLDLLIAPGNVKVHDDVVVCGVGGPVGNLQRQVVVGHGSLQLIHRRGQVLQHRDGRLVGRSLIEVAGPCGGLLARELRRHGVVHR